MTFFIEASVGVSSSAPSVAGVQMGMLTPFGTKMKAMRLTRAALLADCASALSGQHGFQHGQRHCRADAAQKGASR